MGAMTVPHGEQNPMTVWLEGWGKVEREGSSYRGQGKRYLVPTHVPSLGRRGYEALRVKKKRPARRRSVGRKKKGRVW